MSEDNARHPEADSTSPLPFEDFVRQQLALLLSQQNRFAGEIEGLRREMIERFLQLSRQIRELDQKVDIFIKEQIYIKDDIRELREARLPKV